MNNDIWGVMWFGIALGAAAIFFFYHPKYQGKTVEEWYNQYQSVQAYSQSLTSCLTNMRPVSLYDNLYNQYLTNDYYKKADVNYCLGY